MSLIWCVYVLLMAVMQYGDYWTTTRALQLKGVREVNPLIRRLGLIPIKTLTLVCYAAFAWVADQWVVHYVTWGMVLMYGLVIWSNLRVIKNAAN
jgi:hypothetical protein